MSDIKNIVSTNTNNTVQLLDTTSQHENDISSNNKKIILNNQQSKNEILMGNSEFKLEDDNTSFTKEHDGGSISAPLEYKINYLIPNDDKLVNIEKITSTVKKYIDNYNSDAIKKYKQLFKTVYQKYSNKRYFINNTDTNIIVSKLTDGTLKRNKGEIVFEISKPEYIYYNKDNNLINMKTIISNKRQELQLYYQSLVNKINVQTDEKKQFEKERKTFIDLLERYYIYNLYHHQINNISLNNKSNIIVQELQGFLKDNTDIRYILDSNLYIIDNSLVEQINTNNSFRLNLYNELIIKLQSIKSSLNSSTDKTNINKIGKDKIINEIKEYLKSNDENIKLNNEIKINAQMQNKYVDYIICKLPNN